MESQERSSLYVSEWVLLLCFLMLLAAFASIAYCHQHRKFSQAQLLSGVKRRHISITIDGAVSKPGVYSVALGTPLREVLRKSRPKRFASLRGLSLDAPLKCDASFVLVELETLCIHISGAVLEPCSLEVPAGTRLCQLKPRLSLSGSENKQFFKSRRLLKDGESIVVPSCPNFGESPSSKEGDSPLR